MVCVCMCVCVRVCMRVCVRVHVVCVWVVSVTVKRPVLPPSVVDGSSRNPLYYYYDSSKQKDARDRSTSALIY